MTRHIFRFPVRLYNIARKVLRYYKNFGPRNTVKRIKAEWAWAARSRQAAGALRRREKNGGRPFNFLAALGGSPPRAPKTFAPLVSVIVPCCNHAPFLRKRLDSIFNQTYADFEVLLLDDASGDGSAEILREYAARHPRKTRLVLNAHREGSPFSQWSKGIRLARGELVHIAEGDACCDENFLEALTPFFAVRGVELAYSDLRFVRGDNIVDNLENHMRPLAGQWGEDAVFSAHEYVRAYLSRTNTIPHPGGVLFRKKDSLPLLDDPAWRTMRFCGHWLFCLEQIRGGFVAFCGATKSYCRIHDKDGGGAQKQARYYKELEMLARRLARSYKLEKETFHLLRGSLEKLPGPHVDPHVDTGAARSADAFDIDAVLACRKERKLNVAIVLFAFTPGGGEIFPLRLAGGMYGRGCAVTLLNAGLAPETPEIRAMLDKNVPCADLDVFQLPLSLLLNALGIDIVHTHHAAQDLAVSREKRLCPECAHVVTAHGMYEAAFTGEEAAMFARLHSTVAMWIYVAEKNLSPLLRTGTIALDRLRHIPNAMPPAAFTPVARSTLGIADDDFVLCLASRALPEKGWEEAVQAVKLANAASRRKIRLLLIGTGEMRRRLQKEASPNVLLLGFKENVQDYFAMADMGFLPSRYAGESQPLAVAECLLAGRPVLASRLGEIPRQLAASPAPPGCRPDEKNSAGILFDLVDGKIDIRALAVLIVECAEDSGRYGALLANVPGAAAKFNFDAMLDAYYSGYLHALRNPVRLCEALPGTTGTEKKGPPRMRKNNTGQPVVSIIMASYNYACFIEKAIQSILDQSEDAWELLVVDDGSTDDSVEIVRRFAGADSRIRLLRHEDRKNHGLPETLRLGISRARGEYLAFLESDDLWSPDCLERRLACFAVNKEAGAVFNHLSLINMNSGAAYGDRLMVESVYNRFLERNGSFDLFGALLVQNCIPSFSCIMVRADLLRSVNLDSPVPRWLDWWVWLQIACVASFAYTGAVCTFWRVHDKSYNRGRNFCGYLRDIAVMWAGIQKAYGNAPDSTAKRCRLLLRLPVAFPLALRAMDMMLRCGPLGAARRIASKICRQP